MKLLIKYNNETLFFKPTADYSRGQIKERIKLGFLKYHCERERNTKTAYQTFSLNFNVNNIIEENGLWEIEFIEGNDKWLKKMTLDPANPMFKPVVIPLIDLGSLENIIGNFTLDSSDEDKDSAISENYPFNYS